MGYEATYQVAAGAYKYVCGPDRHYYQRLLSDGTTFTVELRPITPLVYRP
jgi:hypothetical protein